MELKNIIYFKNKLFNIRMKERANHIELKRAYNMLERVKDKMALSLKEKEELLKELTDYKNGKSI